MLRCVVITLFFFFYCSALESYGYHFYVVIMQCEQHLVWLLLINDVNRDEGRLMYESEEETYVQFILLDYVNCDLEEKLV